MDLGKQFRSICCTVEIGESGSGPAESAVVYDDSNARRGPAAGAGFGGLRWVDGSTAGRIETARRGGIGGCNGWVWFAG